LEGNNPALLELSSQVDYLTVVGRQMPGQETIIGAFKWKTNDFS
jgi:hypothetical protein